MAVEADRSGAVRMFERPAGGQAAAERVTDNGGALESRRPDHGREIFHRRGPAPRAVAGGSVPTQIERDDAVIRAQQRAGDVPRGEVATGAVQEDQR